MQEKFLHFVWQFQYFNRQQLTTTTGQSLNILDPGHPHVDAGPDFKSGTVKIDGLLWYGHVEIHYKSSMWIQHGHQKDLAYDNVVLHVVWSDDHPIFRSDGTPIPTLELKQRIDPEVLQKFQYLEASENELPCTSRFGQIGDLEKLSMVEKALTLRLQRKAEEVEASISQNKGDWEETTYQLLARSFGFKVNAIPFEKLAQRLPYSLLHKYHGRPLPTEALVMGQAGFLEKQEGDAYYLQLKREYTFLSHKYSLDDSRLKPVEWKFMRMRPANFPTLRLAQFSAFIAASRHLFSQLLQVEETKELKSLLKVEPNDYWRTHYHFHKTTAPHSARLGTHSIQTVAINTIAPILAAYRNFSGEELYMERALNLLAHIPPEKNKITKIWNQHQVVADHAFDSQGMLGWYQDYCLKRNCHYCNVGVQLLKPGA